MGDAYFVSNAVVVQPSPKTGRLLTMLLLVVQPTTGIDNLSAEWLTGGGCAAHTNEGESLPLFQ